jgi:predicted cobalt transporter CbtA
MESEVASAKAGEEKKFPGKGFSRMAIAVIAVVVIVGIAIFYQFVFRPSSSKIEVASRKRWPSPFRINPPSQFWRLPI